MKLTLILISVLVAVTAADSYRRVCYHTNWAQYRNGPAKFYPENIDPSLCTHIIYAFAKLVGNKLAAFEWNDESTPWMKGMYERFGAIKQQNPSVKLLLAVGGWNMGSAPFTAMVSSDANRRQFATTTVAFLRKNNFDGLDMDWEYPANRGSPAIDKQRFTQLLRALRDEFSREAVPAGKSPLMLTAAVAAGKDKIDTAYEIPQISNLLDMINLMTYDLHGSWEDHTGHHSPLFARSSETGNDTYLNMDYVAQYWVKNGADKSKMNIGLGLYGRSFKLPYSHTSEKIGCAAAGAGQAGTYTREGGFLAYYEICEKLKSGATKYFEQEQRVPYLATGDLWVGYDDPDSLKLKVDYVKQEHFGGIMVWALDLDDFSGLCGQGKYPLMRSIVQELGTNTGPVATNLPIVTTHAPAPVTTTQAPWVWTTTHAPAPVTTTQAPWVWTTTTAPHVQTTTHAQAPVTTTKATTKAPVTTPPVATDMPTTTAASAAQTTTQAQGNGGSGGTHHDLVYVSNNEFACSSRTDGYYPSPTSCSNYYVCAAGMTFRTDCHPGLLFNDQTLYCDFPDHVTCHAHNGGQQPATSAPMPTNPPVTTHAPVVTNAPVTHAPPATTRAPIQITTTAGSVNLQPADFCKGKSDGFFSDPQDCSYFYQCSFEVAYHEPCPAGTYFSPALQGCDWANNVPSCP